MFNQYPYVNQADLNLDWLLSKYRELTAEMANLRQEWADHRAEYNDVIRRLNIIERDITTINTELVNVNRRISNQYDTITAEYTALFNSLSIRLTAELTQFRIDLNNFKNEVYTIISENNDNVIERVNAILDVFIHNLPDYEHLIVYNPVRGEQTTIQIAINDLYNFYRAYALTAFEYDSLGLTADEYDNMGLTAFEYDNYGYKLLRFPDPNYYMYSPFTGTLEKISTVVYNLFELHRTSALTAQAYDALDMTADDYDALQLEAYQYDMYGI